MKSEMNAFDILAMVQEMQVLIGGYVDKVFHWGHRNVLFRINAPGGRRELLFLDGHWLFMPKDRPETPDTPSGFAVHLRKMLSNARVSGVTQRQFDRIVVMELSTREGPYQVVFELFGEGNLVVVEKGIISNCLEQKTWRHRDVRIGMEYQYPPPRFDPQTGDAKEFMEAVSGSNADVVRTLATSGNLGGQYAEELCLRSDIDKSRKAKSLTVEEWSHLQEGMKEILTMVRDRTSPQVIYEGDYAIDAAPVLLELHQGKEAVPFPTLSEAFDEYLYARAPEEVQVRDEEEERLERQLDQQMESVERFQKESFSLSEKANLLYAHYSDVVKLLTVLDQKAEEMNWAQLQEFVRPLPFVVRLEPQKEMVMVRIAEQEVPLHYRSSIDENANLLFSQAKEMKEKWKGAEAAMQETELRLEQHRRLGEERRRSARPKAKPTKQFWFENYRWFVTAKGRLVLGGRDARSNEQLVKKHLQTQDRYAHADVHGAASVIIKDGANADEEELREACLFALASSKAWGAGVSEGSAYWVLPDQVSKTPEAGEFVPRGGFIIRGKRNYLHHLPLRLAIGEVQIEGQRKVMCAPVETIRALSQRYVVIAPGDLSRGQLSAQVSKVMEVPEEEISRILPPGDVEIVEMVGMEI